MKLQPDRIQGQTVTGHGAGWIGLDGEKFHQNMMITWLGVREVWHEDFSDFEHSPLLPTLLQAQPEILLLGYASAGNALSPKQLAPLWKRNIGVETMDTAAACRTYNILAAENRKVAAILLIYGQAIPKP